MGELTSVHRLFLQTCSGSGCMSEEEALKAFSIIADKRAATNDDMAKCIKAINKKLAPMAQEISVTKCGITNGNFVVFADTSEAAIMKEQTNFTEPELSFFRDLLRALATAPAFQLDAIAAINVTNQQRIGAKSIAKSRAEELLDLWTNQGYLTNVDEVLNFGPRCIVEFGNYLQKNFPQHAIACMLCKVLVLRSVECADCSQRFHVHCIRNYMKKTSNCAKCKKTWRVPL